MRLPRHRISAMIRGNDKPNRSAAAPDVKTVRISTVASGAILPPPVLRGRVGKGFTTTGWLRRAPFGPELRADHDRPQPHTALPPFRSAAATPSPSLQPDRRTPRLQP